MQAHRIHVMIKVNEKSNRQQTELILRSSPPTSQSEQRWGNGMMMKRDRKGKIDRNRQIETGKCWQGVKRKGYREGKKEKKKRIAGDRVNVRQPWREEGGASHPLPEPLLWGRHLFP